MFAFYKINLFKKFLIYSIIYRMRTDFLKNNKFITKLSIMLDGHYKTDPDSSKVQNERGGNFKMPKKPIIDKEFFKRSVLYNVKTLYRKNLEEATPQQIFQAVSYAVKDAIVDNWLKTQEAYDEKDPKIVYYMSMEFLMGRALGNT